MNTLTQLGIKYSTDKAFFHSFTDFYNEYFMDIANSNTNINILELGIFKGASLKMLGEYFKNATIYAIDIDDACVNNYYGENIKTFNCSQIDFITLKKLFNNITFDIIIDDGSHITSHQQLSLGFLFPFLKKNGIYVCEDLHTSFCKDYLDTDISTLHILENYKNTRDIQISLLNERENKYLKDNITDIKLYYRTTNALKCYKCNNQNINNNEVCVCGIDLSPNNKSITSIIFHK